MHESVRDRLGDLDVRVGVELGQGGIFDLGRLDRDIDFVSEVEGPLADFDSEETDSPATVANWRRTTCEQGLFYRDRAGELIDKIRGQYIYLQDGEVGGS